MNERQYQPCKSLVVNVWQYVKQKGYNLYAALLLGFEVRTNGRSACQEEAAYRNN